MEPIETVPWIRRPLHTPGTPGTLISDPCVKTTVAKRRNKGEEKQTARKRIAILLRTARAEALGPDKDLAHSHGELALRVARRYQVPLYPDQKAQVCRKCGAYRTTDASRVRIRAGRIVTSCLQCGHTHRRPVRSKVASVPESATPSSSTPEASS